MSYLENLWAWAKVGASLRFGPVTVHTRLRKSPLKSFRKLVQRSDFRITPATCSCIEAKNVLPPPAVKTQTALIVGCGDGLGTSLARRFAAANMNVMMARRRSELLGPLVSELGAMGVNSCAVTCDATDSRSVEKLFKVTQERFGNPNLVIYNVENFSGGSTLDIAPDGFEDCWRANCLGGFFVAREAARRMVDREGGTIIFSGATASLRGRDGYLNLAVGKFGLRALAQCMARELGPKGVHVAHVLIDGGMNAMGPDAVAENYSRIHDQPRTAWTHEIDLRRFDEPW